MTEFRDLSRLPADQSYWDSLEARINAELAPLVRAAADRKPVWWRPLAARAWVLGGLAAAAAVAALLLVPSRSAGEPTNPTGLLRPPDDDPALVAFLSAREPPDVAALMLTAAGSDR
jgi:hypothetical protein